MFVNNVLEPEVKKNNKEFSFDKFLEFCKKQENMIVDKKTTKQGNTKIRYNDKIVFYAHSGKISPVILWSNIEKKNIKVSNQNEAEKLIVTISTN